MNGTLDKLPPHLLTSKNLLKQSFAEWSPIIMGEWSDDRQENIRTHIEFAEKNGSSPLQLAGIYNHLDQIPKELLTPENFYLTNMLGLSSFHWAAMKGTLDKIPFELKAEHLLCKESHGWTPLHVAAWTNNLGQVPEDILEAHILAKDEKGVSVLADAVTFHGLDGPMKIKLPEEARDIVGAEWLEKQQQALSDLNALSNNNEQNEADLDIF